MVRFAISQFLVFLESTETYFPLFLSFFFFSWKAHTQYFPKGEILKVIYANYSVSVLNTEGQAENA